MFGPKEWEQQMSELALAHVNIKWRKQNLIVGSYNQLAYRKINKIRDEISEASSDIISMIPSARWLFDNFQMIYREIKKVKTMGIGCMPFPILESTKYEGYPRIYVVTKRMVEISDGHLNEENMITMINAYQDIIALTERELQALPEMMGLCLLERIIDISVQITDTIKAKAKAEKFIKKTIAKEQEFFDIGHLLTNPGKTVDEISFHSHLVYLLKNMSVEENEINRYVAYHLGDNKNILKAADLYKEEGKQECILESLIRLPIISLRELNQLNEEDLVENFSIVEKILTNDPANVYRDMDSRSRSMYRSIIEKMAIKHGIDENKIAADCIELAKEGWENIYQPHHVGAYLIGRGSKILRAKILGRSIPKNIKVKSYLKGNSYFIFGTATLMALIIIVINIMMVLGQVKNGYIPILFILLAFPILMQVAKKITNMFFIRITPPVIIPSMDYTKGLPDEARTAIIMPVIASNKDQALEYAARLYQHYLSNRQENLYFAILLDFEDHSEEEAPEDKEITEILISYFEVLNKKYKGENDKFLLILRKRIWNEKEKSYIAWERKRGKLEEFNALINGIDIKETSFIDLDYDMKLIKSFKYIITLDADSNLYNDNGAAKLAGMIDHPLNHASLYQDKKKVKEGYAIIQPLIKNHIYDSDASLFTKVFGGESGLSNYPIAISDVFHDVFQEGSFVGKGIYNARVFHEVLYKRLPENSVLSHDLLESCYINTAFTSSTFLIENFPSNYISYIKRSHRWVRGDWQLLPWVFRRDLGVLSKYKILTNLSESLLPISKFFIIVLNPILVPSLAWLWLPLILFNYAFDLVSFLIKVIIQKILRVSLTLVYTRFFDRLSQILIKTMLDIVFIPIEAANSLNAILVSLYRLAITKENLLQWESADQVERSAVNILQDYFKYFGAKSIMSALILLFPLIMVMDTLPMMIVYTFLIFKWGLSFYTAYGISKKQNVLIYEKNEGFELVNDSARRIWRFFRDFSTVENNYLCPDNYQLADKEKITEKTSPTNIGLQLLSIISAKDLGFETLCSMIDDIEKVLKTIEKLPTWNGHLFNWYNTRDLSLLPPHYVSTVDSGNYFGDLIALKYGLIEQITEAIFNEKLILELNTLLKRCNVTEDIGGNDLNFVDLVSELKRVKNTMNKEINTKSTRDQDDFWRLVDLIEEEVAVFNLGKQKISDRATIDGLVESGNENAVAMKKRILGLVSMIDKSLDEVDFTALYNKKRELFLIGYNDSSKSYDEGTYDLCASEALLTSFMAIARGEISIKNWQKLGRPLTLINGIPTHVSWSGTMFEYLMPNLIMKEYEGSVFAESAKAAVIQQIKYGKINGVPWGISESQYHRFDINSNYQYKAFGVPKIRLQQSYDDPLVISPYSTMLAIEYDEKEAIKNLERIKQLGAYGEYGFYEAIDFSAPDPLQMTDYRIVKSFMAHHHGMSMVAINNYFNDGIMRERFHRDPEMKAAETLLEEKQSNFFVSISKKGYTVDIKKEESYDEDVLGSRFIKTVSPEMPIVNYLSNDKYSVLITSDGDGFSKYENLMINRWRPDPYSKTGNYIYIKDLDDNHYWSAGYNPTQTKADEYQAIFSHHKAEFQRRDASILTHTIVSISPDHNMEIRKVILKNISNNIKRIQVTSYMEPVADDYLAELSHPAFNKLFLESEYLEDSRVFVSKRRSNTKEQNPYLVHMLRTTSSDYIEYENDRFKFIGRNNSVADPEVIKKNLPLTNSCGFSTDPIMSLRTEIELEPDTEASIVFFTGICKDMDEVVRLSDEMSVVDKDCDIIEKFRQQSIVELKYLNIPSEKLNAIQNIISPLFYPSRQYRGVAESIERNWKDQNTLWKFGVSGDNPIMLLLVSSTEEAKLIKDTLRLYEYLRVNRIQLDLVIYSEGKYGYSQNLDYLLNSMTSSMRVYDDKNKPGIFIIHSYQMSPAETDLLFTVARVVFSKKTGIYFRSVQSKTRRKKKKDN